MTQDRYEYEERAAIRQHDGKQPREVAEREAKREQLAIIERRKRDELSK